MYKSIKLKNDNDDETDDCNTVESDETIFLQTYAVVLDFYTKHQNFLGKRPYFNCNELN